MATPSFLAVLQAAQRPAFYDRWVVMLIVVACATAVVVNSAYPFSFRTLGLGSLFLLAGVAGVFAQSAAGPRFYPALGDALPVLRYPETLWVVRFLFVAGALGVIAGFIMLLWRDAHDPETTLTWRQVVRRLVVLAAITGLVWAALWAVHGWRR